MSRKPHPRLAALAALIVVACLALTGCNPTMKETAGTGKMATSSTNASSSASASASASPSATSSDSASASASATATSAPAPGTATSAAPTPARTTTSPAKPATTVAPPPATSAAPAPPANLQGFCRRANGEKWDYLRVSNLSAWVFQTENPSGGQEYWDTAGFPVLERINSNLSAFPAVNAGDNRAQVFWTSADGNPNPGGDWLALQDYLAKKGGANKDAEAASLNDYLSLWRALATASPAAPSCP